MNHIRRFHLKALVLSLITFISIAALADGSKLWDGSVPAGAPMPVPGPNTGSYYDWGRAQNGWGYCYEYTNYGQVLNQGMPVSNWNCEQAHPSYYSWGQAQSGWGYCYQYTSYGVAMNEGSPVSNYSCEQTSPSYYSWGRGNDGYTHCYQYTGSGVAMNEGNPVGDFYCR
jgi:hypothetical protein